MSTMPNKLVYCIMDGADYSCSLSCSKVHKETCTPTPNENPKGDDAVKGGRLPAHHSNLEREYALLSPGQLAMLRMPLNICTLMPGKNADLINYLNSPNLSVFLKNILSEIPSGTDLNDVTIQSTAAIEKALSLIQQVRTEESGTVVADLESLIDQIHHVSGEYRY